MDTDHQMPLAAGEKEPPDRNLRRVMIDMVDAMGGPFGDPEKTNWALVRRLAILYPGACAELDDHCRGEQPKWMRGVGYPLQWAVRRGAPKDVLQTLTRCFPLAAKRLPPGGDRVVNLAMSQEKAAAYAKTIEDSKHAHKIKKLNLRASRKNILVCTKINKDSEQGSGYSNLGPFRHYSPQYHHDDKIKELLTATPTTSISSLGMSDVSSISDNLSTSPVVTLASTSNFGLALIFPSRRNDEPGEAERLGDDALECALLDMCPFQKASARNLSAIRTLDASYSGLTLTMAEKSRRTKNRDKRLRQNRSSQLLTRLSPPRLPSLQAQRLRKTRLRRGEVSLCSALGIKDYCSEKSPMKAQKTLVSNNPLKNTFKQPLIGARWLSWLNLRCLNLEGCKSITDCGVACLAAYMGDTLESICLARIPKLSNRSLYHLRDKCRRLHTIDISHSGTDQITGVGCAWMLVKGRLSHCKLAGIPGVDDELVLGSVRKVCNVGIKRSKEKLYNSVPSRSKRSQSYNYLRTLDISNCGIIDSALQYFPLSMVKSGMTSLNLSGPGNDISDVGLSVILDHLACSSVDDPTPSPLVLLNLSYLPKVTSRVVPRLLYGCDEAEKGSVNTKKALSYLEELDIRGTHIFADKLLEQIIPSNRKLDSIPLLAPELRCLGVDVRKKSAGKLGFLVSQFRRLHVLRIGQCEGFCEFAESLAYAQKKQFTKNTFTFTRPFLQSKEWHIARMRISNYVRMPSLPSIVATQSSTPAGCEKHRCAAVALNGIVNGIYGSTIIDPEATTTITLMERGAWWEVDLGRPERIGWVKILLPDPTHRKSRDSCLRMQFPLWLFLLDKDYDEKIVRACKQTRGDPSQPDCPSREMLSVSVWSKQITWNREKSSTCNGTQWRTARSLWCKVPVSVGAIRFIRIQHGSSDPNYPEGKPLSLAEVSVLPLRLERAEVPSIDSGSVAEGKAIDKSLRLLTEANPHLSSPSGMWQRLREK